MKVGIITYHGAHNYGSALQTYALWNAVKNEGHNVEVINYRTLRQDDLYRLYSKPNKIMNIVRNAQSFVYKNDLVKHHCKFESFLSDNIVLSDKEIRDKNELVELNHIYDCFICGSDQIWNPNCIDFDSSYLLDFVSDKSKCFSYAPSIASNCIDEKWKKCFHDNLVLFSDLSIREDSGGKIISEITSRKVKTVLDPVFLLSDSYWKNISSDSMSYAGIKSEYILCYFIGDIPGMRKYAKELGKKYKLPIIVININLRDLKMNCIKRYDCGPLDFVDLIYNAKIICTNSFHAISFSLLFDKEFHAFVDNTHENSAKSRITDILKTLNMECRLVDNCSEILPSMEKGDFDYHDKLDLYILASKKYLKEALSKVDSNRRS